jgi:NDP-sugar pyrophosphorylase family protein
MTQIPTLVILAGGGSSRLWPLADKSLIEFAGVPLIRRHLEIFNRLGFEEAVIVANPENRGRLRAVASAWRGGHVEVVVQPEPIGMGDAILRAGDCLKARGYPPIYVTQAHDVVNESLHRQVLEAYRQGSADSYLAGYQVSEYFPGGYLVIDADDRISGMVEKPGPGHEPSDLVSIVNHLHANPAPLLEQIRQVYASGHVTDDHYEFAMSQHMVSARYKAVRYRGPWKALKFPWQVLDVMNFFLGQIDGQHISPQAQVTESASIAGNVVIEAGARVFHTASIVGPAYIGADTIVGNGALVRASMIGAGCAVGHTSEVARSYLADGCQLHRAVVLDSVFDKNVNFSAGCITANLRWDRGTAKTTVRGQRVDTGRDKLGAIIGRDAFISISAGTMPGVKIGRRAVIGPFTSVLRDVPDDALLFAEQATVQKTMGEV